MLDGHLCGTEMRDLADRTAAFAPDITVVTTATNDDEGRALLRALGFPFKEN